jgi:hypothetical protein
VGQEPLLLVQHCHGAFVAGGLDGEYSHGHLLT